jgi:hypothetical protein
MADKKTKAVLGLIVVIVVVMIPGLVLALLQHPAYSSVAGFGALSCLVASLVGGWRLGVMVSLPLALASGLALGLADNPWSASVLMLLVAGGAGLTAHRGYAQGVTLSVITVAFVLAQPPTGAHATSAEAAQGAVIMLVSGLFAAGVGALVTRKGPVLKPEPYGWGRTVNYAVVLGLLVGVATWFVVDLQLEHSGAWLLMTILVVVQPSLRDGFRTSLERAVGTIVGVVIALVIGLIALPTSLVYILSVGFLTIALITKTQSKPYWEFAALLTPAVVLLQGVKDSITSSAQERLFATLIGAGAALAVMGCEVVILRSRAPRDVAEGVQCVDV